MIFIIKEICYGKNLGHFSIVFEKKKSKIQRSKKNDPENIHKIRKAYDNRGTLPRCP